jgi:hypothetical protein
MIVLEPLEELDEDTDEEGPTSTLRLIQRRRSDPLILQPVDTPYSVMVSGEAKREVLRLREALTELTERDAERALESVSAPRSGWRLPGWRLPVALLVAFGLGSVAHLLPWGRLLAPLLAHLR